MPEGRFDISVDDWSCRVINQHRKAFGRKIRQRTVLHLRGIAHGAGGEQTAGVYLMFERGAHEHEPAITATDDPRERLRVEAYLLHGQEAAALAVLQSGYRTWARFSENALGQTSFALESGPEPGTAVEPAAAQVETPA
jgi:hypothetical protein